MKFTADELHSIEHTADKLMTAARAMWGSETQDATNARHLAFIVSEIRLCADLMKSEDRATRLAGADRLTSLITN